MAGPREAYAHAFVLLAAGSARMAGVRGAGALLGEAGDVVEARFLDERGRAVDSWDPRAARPDDYRGANAAMHLVEAFLATGDVTQEHVWHDRALAIAHHLVHEVAAPRDHLLPEHFDADWTPLPDYNIDDPADPFRPYGVAPGHLMEWSRLLLHLDASLAAPPAWLLTDAAALHRRTGEAAYDGWRERFEDFCRRHLVDPVHGSWHHELDEHNRPAATTWQGKPDVHHAHQALLVRDRPLAPALSVQLAG